ncbi:MAG: DNA repair protein RadC [Alphaproteobacteria bacterium]|nr:DNA repair protein RadC [Alphaproteobacteria bacterium]
MSTEPSNIIKKSKPHYTGHRQRLRERFLIGGADALQDYELLELILFMAIPRKDVKPLAKDLLETSGSLSALMSTPHSVLSQMDNMSENAATAIKAISAIAQRMMKQDLMEKPVLNNWTRLMDYSHISMDHETKEHFRILFLNKKNMLIADEIQASGTVDHTPAYPREIMKRALELGATAMILMHNHPSGDPKPSQADVEMTKMIADAASTFNIAIHDHIVMARGSHFSFKQEGLI